MQPEGEWRRNGQSKVDFIAEAVIPASLTQLIMDLPGRATTLSIRSLRTELRVLGGKPSAIRIVGGPRTYDLDPNDDGVAEDVHLRIVAPTRTITNDGSPSVGFRIEHFVATLQGLPLLGDLVMSDTKPPSSARRPCKLGSETLGFRAFE